MNGEAKRDPNDLACNGSPNIGMLRPFSLGYSNSTTLITGTHCSLMIEVAPTPHLGSNFELWHVLVQLNLFWPSCKTGFVCLEFPGHLSPEQTVPLSASVL